MNHNKNSKTIIHHNCNVEIHNTQSNTSFSELFKKALFDQYGQVIADLDQLILRIIMAEDHCFYRGGFTYFYCREIDRHIKSSNFLALVLFNNLFFVRSYKKKSFTRGYKAQDKLIECFNKAISQYAMLKVCKSQSDSTIKSKHINSQRKGGGRSTFTATIFNATLIDVKAVRDYLYSCTLQVNLLSKCAKTSHYRGTDHNNYTLNTLERVKHHQKHALILLLQAKDKSLIGYGWVPSHYRQGGTGRIYCDGMSLQNAPRALRAAALGQCYEYDMANCHYEFLRQRTNTYTPFINQYCHDKTAIRNQLSAQLKLPIKTIKTILLTLIYGANAYTYLPELKDRDASAISEACGNEETFYRVITNPIIAGIRDEIAAAATCLISQYTINGQLTNAMKCRYTKENVVSKKLAHVLQGLECAALDAIANITGSDTALLLHDGIYTRSKWDEMCFSQAILKVSGCNIKVVEKSTHASFELEANKSVTLTDKGIEGIIPIGNKTLDIGRCGYVSLSGCEYLSTKHNSDIYDQENVRHKFVIPHIEVNKIQI